MKGGGGREKNCRAEKRKRRKKGGVNFTIQLFFSVFSMGMKEENKGQLQGTERKEEEERESFIDDHSLTIHLTIKVGKKKKEKAKGKCKLQKEGRREKSIDN